MTTAPPATRAPLLAVRGKPVRLPWSRGFWAVTAFLLAWLAVIGALEITPRTAAPLQFATTLGWTFSQDGERADFASVAAASLVTVPIRSGEIQGVRLDVYNPSKLTQTVEGLAANSVAPGGMNAWIQASAGDGVSFPQAFSRQGSPVVVPPHQSRFVGLFWLSTNCMPAGSSEYTDSLRLRVKVGIIERDETIHLSTAFGVSGPSDPLPSASNPLCG